MPASPGSLFAHRRADGGQAGLDLQMHVLVAAVDIHLPAAQSLKEKRSVVQSLVRQLDQRNGLAASEVAHHDLWQRCGLGVVAVSGSDRHATEMMDDAERYVWSRPEVDVLAFDRSWWEEP